LSFAHQLRNVQVVPIAATRFPASLASAVPNQKTYGCGREWRGAELRAPKRLVLYPTFPATLGRLRLLGLLRDARRGSRNLQSPALEVRGLVDRLRGKAREFLGVLVVAVVARLERDRQKSRGAVAQASCMVVPVGHPPNNDRFAEFVA
jgi:hypothetical protein